jgi:ABC-type transport system involved in cytochrome c biogenesis permease subunit
MIQKVIGQGCRGVWPYALTNAILLIKGILKMKILQLASFALYLLGLFTVPFRKIKAYKLITTAGLLLHTAALILRTIEVGHAPMANRYETLLFFSWAIILTNLIVVLRYNVAKTSLITTPIGLILLFWAMGASDAITPMYPALKTRWFEIHVTSAFASYALFTLAMAGAILFLSTGEEESKTFSDINNKAVLWGFVLFSLSMYSGAIWGYLAWGAYWMWEPKMLWSFILWFYYAGILHGKYIKAWRGRPVAYLTIVGFGIVLFTYLGVSILMRSTHQL